MPSGVEQGSGGSGQQSGNNGHGTGSSDQASGSHGSGSGNSGSSSADNNAGSGSNVCNEGGSSGPTQTVTASGSGTTTTILPTCPYANDVTYTSTLGMLYSVFCYTNINDPTIDTQTQNSLTSCINACDMYNIKSFMTASPCMGVSWNTIQSTDNCLLKASGNSSIQSADFVSARLISPYTGPGPTSNGTGLGTGPSQTVVTSVVGGSTYYSTYRTIDGISTVH